MLKTGNVVRYLKNQKGPVSFDSIWKELGTEIKISLGKEMPDEVIKSDLYISLIEDERILMVGGNEWTLKEGYSLAEIEALEKRVVTEEAEINLDSEDISDETKELKLQIIDNDDDDINLSEDSLDDNDELE